MNTRMRLLAVLAALVGLGALILPLWEVRLGAPQYPEGLGLRIYAHTVTGIKPNDLNNINGLNHYIGMKAITPRHHSRTEIHALRDRRLLLAGIALAAARRTPQPLVWLGCFAILGMVGLWDFWRWEHD